MHFPKIRRPGHEACWLRKFMGYIWIERIVWCQVNSQMELRQTGIVRTIIQAEERKGVKPWLWSDHLLQFVFAEWSIVYNERSIREHFFQWTLPGENLDAVGHRPVAIFLSVRRGYSHNLLISSSKMESSMPKYWDLNENWLRSGVGIVVDRLSRAKWSKWIFNSWEEDKRVLRC